MPADGPGSIQAAAHFIALASPHIGSGPGEFGLSGRQVKPLLPRRRMHMFPSASRATIAAAAATASGAAAMALLIMSSSVIAIGAACCCAPAPAAKATNGRLTARRRASVVVLVPMLDLPGSRRLTPRPLPDGPRNFTTPALGRQGTLAGLATGGRL